MNKAIVLTLIVLFANIVILSVAGWYLSQLHLINALYGYTLISVIGLLYKHVLMRWL